MNITMTLNQELNGVELYFEGKPERNILDNLKEFGYRWSNFKKCWYAKQNEKTLNVANELTAKKTITNTKETITEPTVKTIKNDKIISLFNLTKWEDLKANQSLPCKEMAKEIRSHLRNRFPMCKFSVTSTHNTVRAYLMESPYNNKHLDYSRDFEQREYREYEEEHNKELNSIIAYAEKLLNSYKYCTCDDPYGDYGSSYNFYGNVSVDSSYKQTEQNEAIKADITDFRNKLIEQEKEERKQQEIEYQAREKEREEQHQQYLIRQAEEQKEIEHINNNVVVKEIDETEQYYIINSQFANLNKNQRLTQYQEEVKKEDFYLQDLKVTREVHFEDIQALNYFNNMLLTDFDFITGTGGSQTDDERINSMIDYNNMDEEERESVKWYSTGIAVYFNNKLQYVIDAQGYNYARYVGLVADDTRIEKQLKPEPTITVEQLEEYKEKADTITDISTSIIEELNIIDTWNNSDWVSYKDIMKEQLKDYNIKLCKPYVQQINGDLTELKTAMYKLLIEVDGIQEQFKDADIQQGEKITLFYITDFGGMAESRLIFDKVENSKYAQYDKAVKLTFKPEGKRSLYYKYFYSDMLVYKGWLTLPKTVLNEVEYKNGFVVTSSKYGSCDKKQYDDVINYLLEQGHKPIINTYKPIF